MGRLMVGAAASVAAGCSIRPQERVEPVGARGRLIAAVPPTHRQDEAARIGLVILGPPSEATPIGFGFVPGTHQTYVVFDDGSARLFRGSGDFVELESFAPRLSEVLLAGPNRQRIVGFTNRGTWSSWNSANLSQQLLLRPQQATFTQTRVLDVARVSDSPVLATATEGRRMELWSLVSGNLSTASMLPEGIQPRVIMPDSRRNRIVFGTQTGDVRIWNGRRTTTRLYQHQARVLSITRVGNRGIVSTAQDGRAFYYDWSEGRITARLEFQRALYQSYASADGRLAVVVPALGAPGAFGPTMEDAAKMASPPAPRYADGIFLSDNRHFMARQIDGSINIWDVERQTLLRRYNMLIDNDNPAARRQSAMVVDFATAVQQDVVLLTNDNLVQMSGLTRPGGFGTILTSETRLAGIATSSDGRMAMVCLENGQIVRFRIVRDIRGPIPITATAA